MLAALRCAISDVCKHVMKTTFAGA